MNSLPWQMKNEILYKMNIRTLAKMRSTDKYFRSYLSDDPHLKSEYYSRVGSNLLHMSTEGSTMIFYLPSLGSTSQRALETLALRSQILGSSSGLLLLFCGGLCVVNPFTQKYLFIDHSRANLFPKMFEYQTVHWENVTCIGFAVDQIDGTTQRFKIVCINEREAQSGNETVYQFEINAGDSWILSKTSFTCNSSSLDKKNIPVYVNRSLHWLRNDGSIIAFNPETEEARLIPVKFPQPQEPKLKTLLVAAGNKLTLILPTTEVIYVYALENILTDPKWVLVREIRNELVVQNKPIYWDVVAYNDKCLMLRETKEENLVHRYDLRANKWAVMGSIPDWCCAIRDFHLFEPWYSSVIGLSEKKEKRINDVRRISTLSSIMGLIAGVSPEKMEKQIRESLIEEETNSLNSSDESFPTRWTMWIRSSW